jgi:hypothetical protein
VPDEPLSASVVQLMHFTLNFRHKEENLEPHQIYNADKAGVYWKDLCTKHPLSRIKNLRQNISKEHPTAMCFGNSCECFMTKNEWKSLTSYLW